MANDLTPFLGTIVRAVGAVSRGRYGLVRGASRGTGAERAAVNDPVKVPLVPALATVDNTPTMDPGDEGDQAPTSVNVTISKNKAVPVPFTGDDQRLIMNTGNWTEWTQQNLEAGFSAILDEMETDCFNALRIATSRAYGTSGTTPFGTDLTELAEGERILNDNGAPASNRVAVLNTAASAKLRSKAQVSAVNQAGTDVTLRTGELLPMFSFGRVDESTRITTVTKGTGSGYLVDLVAGYAVGATTIHVDTGTGTILAGDVISFQDDSNKYVVKTGFAGDGDGDIVLQEPGLRLALANDKTVTINANYLPSFLFHRGALALAARPPALPIVDGQARDMAVAHQLVVDPATGINFDIGLYLGRGKMELRIAQAWGAAAIQGRHSMTLLG